ncbi:nuclear factor 7, brain-like [Chanos chanos]|uniref:Nuclear factor 7, brain-like n=1 Tax=Chanos chanos TaxID=29144 RepID=A0A6J2W1I8_CHACN|nr:nuclear factor 7, brain-like [Chanos chanos]
MAGRLSMPEEDLCCPICYEIFMDPVVLRCSHSFCAQCLQQHWAQRGRNRDCPVCRSISVDEPVSNLTLKNLCDAFIINIRQSEECLSDELCALHGEKLKVFCLVDRQPICVVCQSSRRHKGHDCCPVAEAITEVKDQLAAALTTLQLKIYDCDQLKLAYENTATHIMTQVQHTERLIREEFEKLHAFLRHEEDARLKRLREEGEKKSVKVKENMKDLEQNVADLTDTIKAIRTTLDLEDISLLRKSKEALQRAQIRTQEQEKSSGNLVDVASHLGSLSYQVWEKMKNVVHYTPVTLDPNTAYPWLVVSDDLTSIQDSDEKQCLPDNPERFDRDNAVLGSQSFSSGRHCWDVEVGDNTAWVLGVAQKSVQRKEKVSSVLKNGFLCIYFYHNMYFAGTSPLTRLALKQKPKRVRVKLEFDRRKLTFLDVDTNTQIYTFKHSFTEEVFPYFWLGSKECPLKIQPLEVAVTAESCT